MIILRYSGTFDSSCTALFLKKKVNIQQVSINHKKKPITFKPTSHQQQCLLSEPASKGFSELYAALLIQTGSCWDWLSLSILSTDGWADRQGWIWMIKSQPLGWNLAHAIAGQGLPVLPVECGTSVRSCSLLVAQRSFLTSFLHYGQPKNFNTFYKNTDLRVALPLSPTKTLMNVTTCMIVLWIKELKLIL